MSNLTFKQKIIAIVTTVGIILILIFQQGLYSKEAPVLDTQTSPTPTIETSAEPKILSTNPSPLEEAVFVPTQEFIEINLNQSLVNGPEFKIKFEPQIEYKTELTNQKKTAKIIFTKPLKLGQSYTLFISPDTKFEEGNRLSGEVVYHFRTIEYRGI
ncbi:MAG: hypothetical protein UU73_C0002G0109 [Candidatus Daviesbacteria bacterium GW2011_GWA1_41_61]|uniref:SbsA Ig-like domain-containing protein n=1 Tax=Candidatus Daviesbacteria bacterium GW2011_GWA2_40_9 TaxID=1618424 RepID=A0A0G0WES9_9BACT|nr:MAG: hypothetical protein UU26_C0019G0013 [Candidatus Daviesbacteria bacterium GW2011_GWC1_40_9]KKR82765.1 MAG: hypothetical protein UU29_C0009G0036 [Candidatus Daviesbacteria bacterium GW2011_GWA2_40_9]KKR93769.1 MAG: hypothetical protein UU44_C0001G0109 [Candidatus Daviesbacteria bacterium GW2011_GWB1_41_15]KKS15235.1 MAG: hypothetical protein UU73_C0002G0109 [Candidatus Daviesbacteria bacterium GW2011_GWA1_41_61]